MSSAASSRCRARKFPRDSAQLRDVIAHNNRAIRLAALVLCLACPAAASAQSVQEAEYLLAVTAMVTELAPRSAHDAALIRDVFQPYVEPLALGDYNEIEEGLATGGLVRLPLDSRFNVACPAGWIQPDWRKGYRPPVELRRCARRDHRLPARCRLTGEVGAD